MKSDAFRAAAESKQIDAAEGLFSPDVVFRSPVFFKPYQGIDVLRFILSRRDIPRLNLMGWSWGCTIMATTAARSPDKVARLALYAPPFLRTTPSLLNAGPGPLGAYRTVTREQARTRWLTGVPEDKKDSLIPAGWFEQWTAATWARRSR